MHLRQRRFLFYSPARLMGRAYRELVMNLANHVTQKCLTADAYRAAPGLNFSRFSSWRESHLHSNLTIVPTAAMRYGTLVHTLVLEPEEFGARYYVHEPFGDMRRKESKEAYDYAVIIAQGRELVDVDQYRAADAAAYRVRERLSREGLTLRETEVSLFCYREWPLKCRIDAVCELDGRTALVDVKTAREAHRPGPWLERAKAQLHYYSQFFKEPPPLFVAAVDPLGCAMYRMRYDPLHWALDPELQVRASINEPHGPYFHATEF
jgi:hypothetical protein